MSDTDLNAAASFASQAAEVLQKLRPGTYESAQSLALVSIAISLEQIAAGLEQRRAG